MVVAMETSQVILQCVLAWMQSLYQLPWTLAENSAVAVGQVVTLMADR